MRLILITVLLFLIACKPEPGVSDKTTVAGSGENVLPPGSEQVKEFYDDGRIHYEGVMVNELREGEWIAYYKDGTLWSRTSFTSGIKHGPTTTYFENGAVRYTGAYNMGQPSGKWVFYGQDGSVQQEISYE